jgi:catechol 2,3-dioxygenase-like lactoylglutathione lyase family enzyme
MIGYITVGTNDFEKASVFYDQILGVIGARRVWETERFITWGNAKGSPMFGLVKPYDGQTASAGNGTMVALTVGSTEKVDEIYQKALAMGGADEGEPGKRTERFYGAYFRDLDGNKLCAYHMG